MRDSTDGEKATASDWEQSVLDSLMQRNRVLAALAFLLLSLSFLWYFQDRSSDLKKAYFAPQNAEGWTVDLNTATYQELQLIPGLGPKLVEAILMRRAELGGFQNLDQLSQVPGIKEQRVRTLSRYLKIIAPCPLDSTDCTSE